MTRRFDTERRNADLFLTDLMGLSRGVSRRAQPFEDAREATAPDARASDREPFFADERGESWRVVARPGARAHWLRDGDLIVRRMPTERGGPGWQCRLKEDVDVETLRGPDGQLSDDIVVLRRRSRWRRTPVPEATGATVESFGQAYGEIVTVCGFFGPNSVQRTEQQVREAVAARAEAEWTAWHTSTGVRRPESDNAMFGRLLGYYMASNRGTASDTLTAMQSAALGIDYGLFLAAIATSAAAATQATLIRNQVLTGAPGATAPGLAARVESDLQHAREAHTGAGDFSAWSAAFISACVRGAAIAQGLETVIGTGAARQHLGADKLLQPTLSHATYTIEARLRRAATPPRLGTYHAFRPDERAPQRGDIIVQDRREHITAAQVVTLAALAGGITHGDIIVDVQPGFVVTIGGNVGDSVRKRRYPRAASGMLMLDAHQLYTQEDNTGTLPALPQASTLNLAGRSTGRILSLLAPIEDCAAVPGQPVAGGILV